MARVVVSEFVSVDGVIQSPGYPDEDRSGGFEHGGWQLALFDEAIGEFVMGGPAGARAGSCWGGGRSTLCGVLAEPARGRPDRAPDQLEAEVRGVADAREPARMERLDRARTRPARAEVGRLRAEPGGDVLVIGSGDLVQSLVREGLVDAYQLMIHPLLLGGGKRAFREGLPRQDLRLVDSRTTPNGIVLLELRRLGRTPASGGDRVSVVASDH